MKYLFCLIFISSCAYRSEKADLIVHNATIYTVNEEFSIAQAMAIKDGKILSIGAEQEILNKYSAGEKIDAMKRPVYPGFIDAHCHFLGYGESLFKVNLTGTASFDEVIQKVLEFSKQISPGNWILGRGWDQNDWKEKVFPDKISLDSLFPETPVFLKRVDGHAALANAAALKIAGINADFKIPGGIVELKNGKLTGILIDNAVDFAEKKIPPFSTEQKKNSILMAQENCFAAGITTVDDAGLSETDIHLIEGLQHENLLKMRIYAMLDANNPDSLIIFLQKKPFKNDRLHVNALKLYADGALGSRGALLLEEYSDKPGHPGLSLNSAEYLAEVAQKALAAGFQLCTHAIGDSANRMTLRIYSDLLKGSNDKRWRIEHAQVIHPDDLKTFREFNIIPSVQPTHATSDMYWAGERLGKNREKFAYAYRDLFEQNNLIALGTDFPVEDISPVKTFYAAVFRKDETGYPENGYFAENALTKEEALKGMTIFAAIANFEENEKGSLEAGKYADFIIMDTDIMQGSEKQVINAKVVSTYINGEKVF